MQSYFDLSRREEEMKEKKRDIEELMSRFFLPDELRNRVRRQEQYRWKKTRGLELDSFVENLSRDLRRDINRHLFSALIKRVPLFDCMDERLLDEMCDRLKPVLLTESCYVVRKGDVVEEMLFIMHGEIESIATDGGRSGIIHRFFLQPGDFCGEELLTWALDPRSTLNLPYSNRTLKSFTNVEAFALRSDDLKIIASQFRRLHGEQVQHTFRFYSQQWNTWAACYIQAAWRRHVRKKLAKTLKEEEKRLQYAFLEGIEASNKLGTTLYATQFVANITLRASRLNPSCSPERAPKLPAILLRKPSEPDFSTDDT